jgi:predicted permease
MRAVKAFAHLGADLRYGFRSLAARPTFTIVAALTLALGIGVNVAMFSLFQQILLRELPVPDPDRLVNLTDPGGKPDGLQFGSAAGGGASVFSYPMFRDLERRQQSFVGIAAHRIFDASLSTGEQARRDTGMFVSGSYFPLLDLRPALGRLLGPQDDAVDGVAESVVLSHAYWQNEFGADPDIVGRTLIVNGSRLAIVGVAPRGFHGTTIGTRARVFVPISFRGTDAPFAIPGHFDREFYWVHLFARLRPGVDREAAEVAVNPVYHAILNELDVPLLVGEDEVTLQQFRTKPLVLAPGSRGQSQLLVPVGGLLSILLSVSGLVLLLCCANVAGLVLVRSSTRRGEIAVRTAMGATRWRLASLLLVESLLLALPAALLSLPLAWLVLRGLANGVPGLPPAAFDLQLSLAAAAVAIALAVSSALVFGLAPIRSLARTDPGQTLQAFGVRQTSSKTVTAFRTALATVQIMLSMTLLALTGVFAQSLANIARIDLGLDVDSIVTFSISPGTSGYSRDASVRLLERLEAELEAVPGADAVATSSWPILSGGALRTGARVGGAEAVIRTHINTISPDLFRALGVGLRAGRDFGPGDATGTIAVVIVNQRFADEIGPGVNLIGRPINVLGREGEIVGVAADVRDENVTSDTVPQLFIPRAQDFGSQSAATFYVRAVGPAAGLIGAVRETAARVDPIVPITSLRTMQEHVGENLTTERYLAAAAAGFAVLATLLAGLGLFGALAYAVALRARELGLRLALGAPATRIRGMVLQQMMAMTLVGVSLGAAAAWMLARTARSLLFGIEAADPLALAGAAAVLVAVTFCAAYVPARRASRVDPIVILRYE